jgi:hypothetical protein
MPPEQRPFLTRWTYAPRIHAPLSIGLLAAILAVASGCGGSNKQSSPGAGTTTTTTIETTTATSSTSGIDPLEGAGTTPVVGTALPKETALLERVAIGRHEGYDRVVFQFKNNLPSYRVEYLEPPLKEDGSGNVVQVKGSAFVVVRMEPASGFDLTKNEGELVYKGPKRLDGSVAGTSVVQEVVRTGDFEAVLHWAIGLSDRVDFRVRPADSPPRLIVDFRNH